MTCDAVQVADGALYGAVHLEQQLARSDGARGASIRNHGAIRGDHNRGHQALRAARHDVQVESNEFFAALNPVARFDARDESFAAEQNRIDADMNQYLHAIRAPNRYSVCT